MKLIERSMLNPPRSEALEAPTVADVMSTVLKSLRRHVWLVVICVVVSMMLALISVVSMTPIYTASATIYIDPRESRGFQEAGGILLNSDALIVDSEVEILLSSTLAERVVQRLDLAVVAEPEPVKRSFTTRIKGIFSSDDAAEGNNGLLTPKEAAVRNAVAKIKSNIDIGRLGGTYVIEIIVHNTDKQLATAIANSYAEEYLLSGLEIQAGKLAQLNSWSSQALHEAIGALQTAEAEVNRFRLINQIDSDGRQVAGSELAELNTALVALRSDRFRNELVLERVRNFLIEGSTDSDVPDVGAEAIAQIRSQILKAEFGYARAIANGNKDTVLAGRLARELQVMKLQLVDQYQRIATQFEKQIEFSIKEEQRLADRAEELRLDVATVSQKESKLQELQMRADGSRAVYQVLLARFHETSEAFAQKTNTARILTAAHVPRGPSSPRTAKVLALGLIGGLFVGLVLVFIREQLDNRIRQPREIEMAGLRVLGAVPAIRSAWFPKNFNRNRIRNDLNAPLLSGGRSDRELAKMTFAVDHPLSEFSETVRSIVFDAAASDPAAKRAQVIAVTSTVSSEGKSTLAANLAAYFAKQGKRVHLIDLDFRNPALSQVFATHRVNWGASKTGEAPPKVAPLRDGKKVADFDFSGQSEQNRMSDMIELVSPGAIATYLESSKENYDVVVLDIGSLSESSDARMCADLADYVVVAVKWGMTSVEQFERAISRGLNRTAKTVGAVLTMVPSSEVLEKSARDEASPTAMVA
ncbi:MAG: P-loop NTPase [Marinosulfonomonas sp.]|nr:P-loop NTPase [Marinosulfonomonas sp.]